MPFDLLQDCIDPERPLPALLADIDAALAAGADPNATPPSARWGHQSLPARVAVMGEPAVLARLLAAGAFHADPDRTPGARKDAGVDLLPKAVRMWVDAAWRFPAHPDGAQETERATRVLEVLARHGASASLDDPALGRSAWSIWREEVEQEFLVNSGESWSPPALARFARATRALVIATADPEATLRQHLRWADLPVVGAAWRSIGFEHHLAASLPGAPPRAARPRL